MTRPLTLLLCLALLAAGCRPSPQPPEAAASSEDQPGIQEAPSAETEPAPEAEAPPAPTWAAEAIEDRLRRLGTLAPDTEEARTVAPLPPGTRTHSWRVRTDEGNADVHLFLYPTARFTEAHLQDVERRASEGERAHARGATLLHLRAGTPERAAELLEALLAP